MDGAVSVCGHFSQAYIACRRVAAVRLDHLRDRRQLAAGIEALIISAGRRPAVGSAATGSEQEDCRRS